MKNRFFAFITAAVLILSSLSIAAYAADESGNIVILFESDVHCSIDGYTKIAALKTEEQEKGNSVAVVSCGDFVQGGTLGAFSKGQYIIDIMNAVGYDVVTLGNHEFDYSIPVLKDLMEQLTAEVVSCNFVSLPDETTVYAPYTILSFGDTDIAFVGITTPESITKTTPKYFMDDNGEYLYDFCGENLYEAVQNSVDKAETEGADYVVALSHLGTEYVTERWTAQEVAKNTNDIDVILDGHSHSIIESDTIPNKDNEDVLISSVGTKFEKIGKLTISSDGDMTTELINTEDYENTDETVDEAIKSIEEQYAVEGSRVIGSSDVKLSTYDEDGNVVIRLAETNIGNFCADAYRAVLDADIGLMNGGGIKVDIEAGDVTYNDIFAVLPWENTICTVEATGQMILDMLEYSVKEYPETSGSFQHVSGIKFSYDPSVPTPVKLDEKGVYAGIDGERRVWSAEILNKETNEYEPIDPNGLYTVASTSYLLKDSGGGNTIFENAEIVDDADLIDTAVIREYIQDYLGGTIGEEYKYTEGRINVAANKSNANADDWINPFSDISENDLYYDCIRTVYENGLMLGVSDTEFAPNSPVTRAMFVTVLYRMEGEPETGESSFSDVADNAYYSDAAAWASENGIVSGISSAQFAPDNALTRENMAMIVYRYAEYKGYDVDEDVIKIIDEYSAVNPEEEDDVQIIVNRAEAAEIFSEVMKAE